MSPPHKAWLLRSPLAQASCARTSPPVDCTRCEDTAADTDTAPLLSRTRPGCDSGAEKCRCGENLPGGKLEARDATLEPRVFEGSRALIDCTHTFPVPLHSVFSLTTAGMHVSLLAGRRVLLLHLSAVIARSPSAVPAPRTFRKGIVAMGKEGEHCYKYSSDCTDAPQSVLHMQKKQPVHYTVAYIADFRSGMPCPRGTCTPLRGETMSQNIE